MLALRGHEAAAMSNARDDSTVTRRGICGGAASIAVAGTTAALASEQTSPTSAAPREKGRPVWLDMDQAELDAAYTQRTYAPNADQILRRRAKNSALVRAHLGEPLRFAYGSTPHEHLDVFASKRPNAPINIFIHGGAWRQRPARNDHFIAETFVHAGAHLVTPDFISVDEAGGSLLPMAEQARRAVAWVYANAERFGGDRDRIYVSGHSSGGHLAGVVLTTDWAALNTPPDVVKGGLCMSGMFDLKAPRLSARSSYVKFTDEMEHALSPQRHLERLRAPVIVAYGTLETPEFQRQSRDFAAALDRAGKPVQLLVAEEYNHFEILDTLANPYGLLGRAVLRQMNLPSA